MLHSFLPKSGLLPTLRVDCHNYCCASDFTCQRNIAKKPSWMLKLSLCWDKGGKRSVKLLVLCSTLGTGNVEVTENGLFILKRVTSVSLCARPARSRRHTAFSRESAPGTGHEHIAAVRWTGQGTGESSRAQTVPRHYTIMRMGVVGRAYGPALRPIYTFAV
jgi:hypothetical protein